MTRRIPGTLAILALLVCVTADAGPAHLAERLPAAKTVFYAEIDAAGLLDEGERALAFVDAEASEQVIYRVRELWGMVRELAANHEFEPMLLDEISKVTATVVVMVKDEVEVVTETFEIPKIDEETGEVIDGEVQEHTTTERKWLTVSVVLDTPSEEIAENFMTEFKGMLDREKEKEPESDEFDRRNIEVERGELISSVEGDTTVGRLDSLLVVSEGNPRELWQALMAPPAERLSETAMYQRIVTSDRTPQVFCVVNVQALFEQMEQEFKATLDELEKEQPDVDATVEGAPATPAAGPAQFQLMQARSRYKIFKAFKQILGFDVWRQAGMSLFSETAGEMSIRDFAILFCHDEPVPPVLAELLDGSGTFVLPRVGNEGQMCAMVRVRLKRIFDEVITSLRASDQKGMMGFDMAMMMMKGMMGVDLTEILDILDSDVYVWVDYVMKEVEVVKDMKANEETGEIEWTKERETKPMPQATLFWGLVDPNAAKTTLNTLFTMLSTNAQFGQYAKKRTYQETEVFCFGQGLAQEDSFPDGLTSFAVVIVDRYLSIGSWEHVGGIIRRMKSGGGKADAELQAIVNEHETANCLVVIPSAFQKRVNELLEEHGETSSKQISSLVDGLSADMLDLEDEELAQRMVDAMKGLLLGLQKLDEKARAMAPETSVMVGAHRDNFYEMRMALEISK